MRRRTGWTWLLAALLWLMPARSVMASGQVGLLLLHSNAALPTSGTVYTGITSFTATWQATLANAEGCLGGSGTYTFGNVSLGVGLSVQVDTAPGTGKSWTFTIYKNGSATSVTCQVSGSATTAADTTHTFTSSPGDLLAIACTASGSPTASVLYNSIALEVQAPSTSQYPWIQCNGGTTIASGLTRYLPIQGDNTPSSTETHVAIPIPETITVSGLYVNLTNAQTGGNSVQVWVDRSTNGGSSFTSTAITCTCTGGASTASDTSDTQTFNAGDLIALRVVTSASAATTGVRCGTLANVAANGDCPIMLAGFTDAQNFAYYSLPWSIYYGGFNTNDNSFPQTIAAPCGYTQSKLYSYCWSGPASGQTLISTSRIGQANGHLTCTNTGAGMASDTTHSDTITAGQSVDFNYVSSATSGSVFSANSFVMSFAQPSSGVVHRRTTDHQRAGTRSP